MSELAILLPWLVPGIALAALVSVPLSGSASRWLDVRRGIAWLGLFSLGVIVASTLSPLDPASVTHRDVRECDFTRMSLAAMADVLRGSDATLNILLFAPFGLAIGLAPLSVRKSVAVVVAVALPFAIEATQLLAVPLGRGCQSADVIDNLTGLAVGLGAGVVVAWLVPVIRRPRAAGG